MNKGKLRLPSEDDEAFMYELIMNEMEKHGFNQYEISNYSKPGYESKHNLVYWDNEEYYGFGAGAHSYIGSSRRSNIGPVNQYIKEIEKGNLPIRSELQLSKKEQMEEEMFLGLRKSTGVPIKTFINKFQLDPLEYYNNEISKLTEEELLVVNNGSIYLTKQGRMLGNIVFQEFIK